MKILHYFLGFPPYRTGGLTKYSFDLMTAQQQDGHCVSALWPGQMLLGSKKVRIKEQGTVNGVVSYELINPLPVPLDEGVADIDAFTASTDPAPYNAFLTHLKPDVIHIHTLMGLHKEFVDVAAQLQIKTVFTSHDYYGICPKVTLYRCGQVCDNDDSCQNCIQCNCSALSQKKIFILQSPLYRQLKNSPLVKRLRKQHRGNFFENEQLPEMPVSQEDVPALAQGYRDLRNYYMDMLSEIDLIHFNSSLTESIYKKYLTPKASQVLSITHRDVKDQRDLPHKESDTLRITCLAPAKPFKGYHVLKQALDALWAEGKQDFILRMYNAVPHPEPYMQIQEEGFSHAELGSIMENTDILVAPSVWYETFGFTVLEALSFGVPVLISDHMGAKDIVGKGGMVLPAGSAEELKQAIAGLTPGKLRQMRQAIRQEVSVKTWPVFMEENYALYGDM